jgi:processive 1,2-diacylglycerol beta-glucosyltransferase
MNNRVLLLAVPIGAGHVAAAKAVEGAINRLDPAIETRFVNAFDWTLPEYGKIYRWFYEYSVRRNQGVLESLYDSTFFKKINLEFLPFIHRILLYHFPRLIKEFKPAVVISTHFSPSYCSLLVKRQFDFELMVIVTDYHIHPFWYNPGVDHYVVAHDDLVEPLGAFGVDRAKILPYGIPISTRFDLKGNKTVLRRKLGLPINRPVMIVMGGKIFGGDWVALLEQLAGFDIELIALCGTNKSLRSRIERIRGKARLSTLGIVSNIQEYIQACDFLITKAGGITTSEAMACGATLILANSLPGLEKYNEDFFASHNAAAVINPGNATSVIGRLLGEPAYGALLRRNLDRLAKHRPATTIAHRVKELLTSSVAK